MQKLMLATVSAWLFAFSCAEKPVPAKGKLNWMSLAEARAGMQTEKRPILIDLYTDWCSWCRVMEKSTYSNDKVIAYIEQKFYPVRLDAETRETLVWENRSYAYDKSNHTNGIALYLTGGQLVYPTTVIIPPGGSGPQAIPGYLKPAELEPIVKYFGEGRYNKESFDSWQKNFKTSW